MLGVLDYYEQKATRHGGVHPQRVQDIQNIRYCIHCIHDVALLESELRLYLATIKTKRLWYTLFWVEESVSELKRMLEVVMSDEQAKTMQLMQIEDDYRMYNQLLISSPQQQSGLSLSKELAGAEEQSPLSMVRKDKTRQALVATQDERAIKAK